MRSSSDNYGYEYPYNQLIINIDSTDGSLDTALWIGLDWTGLSLIETALIKQLHTDGYDRSSPKSCFLGVFP